MILGQAPSMQYRISRKMVYTLFGRANALHTGYWVSINATPQRSFLLCEWTLYSAKKRTTCLNGHIFIVWEKYQTTDPKFISDYIFPNVFLHCQPQSARMSKSGCNITDALETKYILEKKFLSLGNIIFLNKVKFIISYLNNKTGQSKMVYRHYVNL